MDQDIFGDKVFAILRSNPTVHEFAERAGVSLDDAYRIQDKYIAFWQTLIKVRPVDKSAG